MGSIRWRVYINIFVGVYKYSGEVIPALLCSQAQLYFPELYVCLLIHNYTLSSVYVHLGILGLQKETCVLHSFFLQFISCQLKKVYITKVMHDYYRSLRKYRYMKSKEKHIVANHCYYLSAKSSHYIYMYIRNTKIL